MAKAKKSKLAAVISSFADDIAIPPNALEMALSKEDCIRVGMRGDKLAPHQIESIEAEEEEIFSFGPNGNGKSDIFITKFVYECMKYPGQSAVFGCLELSNFQRGEWRELWVPALEDYKKHLIPGLVWLENTSFFGIKFPNGTIGQMVTFIDEGKLQGSSIDLFYGREITTMPDSHHKRLAAQRRPSARMRKAMEACGWDWRNNPILPRYRYMGNSPDYIKDEEKSLGRNSSRSTRHFLYLKRTFYDPAMRGELPPNKRLIRATFEGCDWPAAKAHQQKLREAIGNDRVFQKYADGYWDIYSEEDSFWGQILDDPAMAPWERHVVTWEEFEKYAPLTGKDVPYFGYDDGSYYDLGMVVVVVRHGVAYVAGAADGRNKTPWEVADIARALAPDFDYEEHVARCDPATEKKTYQGQGIADRFGEIRSSGLNIRPATTNDWFVTAEAIRRLLRARALKFVVGRNNGVDKLVMQMKSMLRRPLGAELPHQPMKGTARHMCDALRYIVVDRIVTEQLSMDPGVEELQAKAQDGPTDSDALPRASRDEREVDRPATGAALWEIDEFYRRQGWVNPLRGRSPVDIRRRLSARLGLRSPRTGRGYADEGNYE